MTPAKNQGVCGSCWAFAAVATAEAAHDIGSNNPNLNLDLSEELLIGCGDGSGSCCGGYGSSGLGFIQEPGIPDEACMRYVSGTDCRCTGTNNCPNCRFVSVFGCVETNCTYACADVEDRRVTVDYSGGISAAPPPVDSATVKQYISTAGPLLTTMGAGSAFGAYFDGDIYRCTNDSGTNHAVVLAGYSDSGGYWIVKNSWGTGFGDNGYFKVGYGECHIAMWPSLAVVNGASMPAVAYGSAAYSANKGDPKATITVKLSKASTNWTVLVSYITSDGTARGGQDFTPVFDTLTFSPGETSKTFDVFLLDDGKFHGDEYLNLSVFTPIHARLGSPAAAVLTIVDNRPRPDEFESDDNYYQGKPLDCWSTQTHTIVPAADVDWTQFNIPSEWERLS